LGEKSGYTVKTYNLLSAALLLRGDVDRALKIFESALAELKLDSQEGEQAHLFAGNNDLAALLINYLKCNAMRWGVGRGGDFLKSDPLSSQLLGYLSRVNQGLIGEF
jgi:hypothetical protein